MLLQSWPLRPNASAADNRDGEDGEDDDEGCDDAKAACTLAAKTSIDALPPSLPPSRPPPRPLGPLCRFLGVSMTVIAALPRDVVLAAAAAVAGAVAGEAAALSSSTNTSCTMARDCPSRRTSRLGDILDAAGIGATWKNGAFVCIR